MEQVKFFNVNGVDYSAGGSGGSGTAINASLFFSEDKKVYVKCNKGEITEDDDAVLYRYVTNINKTIKEDNGIAVSRYRGWIKPHASAGLSLSLTKSETLSNDINDYWEVKLAYGDTFDEYQENRDTTDYDNSCSMPTSLKKKCGIAIERDGVRLTDYLHFRVYCKNNDDESIYTTSRW